MTKYEVQVIDVSYTASTVDNNPTLTLYADLVPGKFYSISITSVAGDDNAAGGKKKSEPYIERIRTMVERKNDTLNKCLFNLSFTQIRERMNGAYTRNNFYVVV